MRKINIPIFVSHQGCPNDCIFCNQKIITGVSEKETKSAIYEKIKSYLETSPNQCEIEISFFGGSFTGIEQEMQDMYLNIANEFFYDQRIKGIRISTRPDYIDHGILSNLKNKNVTTIELGVQSMNDEVLLLNKRGLTSKDTINAVKKIKEYNFSLGLQMMTGMYGSNRELDINTATSIVNLKPDFVRIYPTVVIKDTELYNYFLENKYKPNQLSYAVETCLILSKLFSQNNIPVLRMGLMAGEDINEKNVIGPYHSSFRELVESLEYYQKIESELIIKNGYNKNIIIEISPKKVSKVVGNKKSNLIKLREKFNLKSIKTIQNEEISDYKIKIN